ncbi:MMPL family transporter [Psychrobacillus lasiicapitis]|uniref:MMPL family transporter n=1 Tax=Psychrobacillus lasiicapitis TaxID=1636719 RepID=A0A544T6D1_9BACI|nr:MMPL family transporter [Psychrobacillus lasiicapitis]TQR13010.1 MMPL family transporter [Psychrobacillus lasiicapitis]GGA35192.1 membrane protein [Psychrobacillus lasiicapitis]
MKNKRTWLITLTSWLVIVGLLSFLAPSSKEVASTSKNAGLPETALSIQADKIVKENFSSSEGIPLLIVFEKDKGATDEEIQSILTLMEENYPGIPKFSQIPMEHRASFVSEDKKTFFIPLILEGQLESKEIHAQVKEIKKNVSNIIPAGFTIYYTGPAGIASDTIELFSQADIVLLLATVGIIFILLIIIYRSFILAIIPLIGAGIVYGVVDRLIGLTGKFTSITIENQALSIMMILLFAVITDYSLLLYARYKEEQDMKIALAKTRETVLFSGGTILAGVATLAFAIYEPYRNFAPVFAIAVIIMLVAGLTLLPALFAVVKTPKKKEKTTRIWTNVGKVSTKKPWKVAIPILLLLGIGTWHATTIVYSYDLLASFPEELSSREGFTRLGKAFSEGEIAPTTILVKSKDEKVIAGIQEKLEERPLVSQLRPSSSESDKYTQFSIILNANPYSKAALNEVETIRDELKDQHVLVSGETVKQVDIRKINNRDTLLVMGLMTVLIGLMLAFQTRSIRASLLMMFSILLSFGAALGFSTWIFDMFFGYTSFSYRIPLYTFVFLVALGVDYSIMLMSRLKEERKQYGELEAIAKAVEKTGGVISSAGLILAATFAVLISQPVMELKLFGFAVAVGVLLDTFIVRPLLLPALLTITKRGK